MLERSTGIVVAALVALTVAIRILYIDLPGPQGDEVYMPYVALLVKMDQPIGQPLIQLFGRQLPLTVGPYAAALPVYLYLGILQVLFDPLLFRYVNILAAALTTFMVYKLAKELWDSDRIGLIAAALFALAPASVFYSRVGEFSSFLRMPVFAAMALFTFRAFRRAKPSYFYLTCLMLGVAVNIRLDGLWWLPALVLVAGLTQIRTRRPLEISSLVRHAGVGFAAFFVGAIPYSLYLLKDGPGMVKFIAANAAVTGAGADNRMVLQNLWVRVTQVFMLTDGTSLTEMGMHPLADVLPNSLMLAAALALVARGAVRRKPEFGLEFSIAAIASITVSGIITLSILKPWHILMVLIFVTLLVGYLVEQFFRLNRYLGVAMIAILLASNLYALDVDYRGLVAWRGSGGFSPAIFDLTRELEDQEVTSVTSGDWGLARLIYYFSDGTVKTSECFVYGSHPPMPDWFYERIDATLRKDSVWVFYTGTYGDPEGQKAFVTYLASKAIVPRTETVSDTYGPVYVLYHIDARRKQ
ncbi:MAG: glycosyltransferase family 39 protein [Chloroflexi bacterium]|nr:glycosyltransferase family 39 protein [Chloroflexota bacterium]